MGRFVDLTGKQFNKLTVLGRAENVGKLTAWHCRCDCGNEKRIIGSHITSGRIKSCGCLHKEAALRRAKDLTGNRYGRLLVVKKVGKKETKKPQKYLCRCDCGNEIVSGSETLQSGHTKSCGCLKREASFRNIKKAQVAVSEKLRLKLEPGTKKHKLTIIGFSHMGGNHTMWKAKCDCGNTTIVQGSVFNRGKRLSCGCAIGDASRRRGKEKKGTVNLDARWKTADKYIGKRYGKLVVTGVEWKEIKDSSSRTGLKSYLFLEALCDCGGEWVGRAGGLYSGRVTTCGCGVNSSKDELDLLEWLRGHVPCEGQLKLDGWRYDIVVPSANLIIEYNGVWWHSAVNVQSNYHQLKRRVAESHGYRLITIWSDEYSQRPERFHQLILDAIGVNKKKVVGARRFKLKEITHRQAHDHHLAYHVQQGRAVGKFHIGAFLGDTLVCAMTIRKEKGGTVANVVRYTLADGYSAPGLLLKMMKFSEGVSPCERWVTYCDMDHFTGGLYRASGFEATGETLQLSYQKTGVRVRREMYMKKKLVALFGAENVDLSLTEREICENNNVYQVYNSGIVRFERPSLNNT